jgi:adenylate kinase
MRLILLGPPGAGKGTQAKLLSQRFNLPHISTGDILRDVEPNSALGMEVKRYMSCGELVPDEIVTQIVIERISKPDAQGGFILDGFPRTKLQAEMLHSSLKKSTNNTLTYRVIYFDTSSDVSIERLSGRRVCSNCGANYHLKNMPPKKEGICDICGGPLIIREDDKEETVRNRFKVYERQTASLIDYYKERTVLRRISGDLNASEVYQIILDLLSKEGLIRDTF